MSGVSGVICGDDKARAASGQEETERCDIGVIWCI